MVLGILVGTLGLAMAVPAGVDFLYGNDDWEVFATSGLLSVFLGGGLFLATRSSTGQLTIRQAFLLTTLAWVVIPAFAAMPLAFSDLDLTYTDAFFEAMSGITTTGATVISGLDHAPPGILLWRALLQWLGGIGIIVMAITVLPLLRVGGMQLFRMETSGSSDEKALPRVTQIATMIFAIYAALTLVCATALHAAGMSIFEALAHAMTTISTAGFSTSDGSIGHFDSVAIDYIVVLFMLIGGMPFLLYFWILQGMPERFLRDSQVRWFLGIVLCVTLVMTLWQYFNHQTSIFTALRYAAFNVTSVMTGTGYATTDFGAWGGGAVTIFFFLMFVGGCAGSTSCGIKVFRLQVVFEMTRVRLRSLWQPHGVFLPRYNGQPLTDSTIAAVMSFLVLFAICFAVFTFALSLLGLDIVTAASGAATALANVGPGLGPTIGPAGTFASLPDAAKWLLSAAMLLGRLELLTVLVLFTRRFWLT
jgi:trk system potassium uptake protein TrkH